jgi:RNA polymerase sigma factor (sigma-70 family)
MSPLNVRRYRAERLLRGEFEALRGRVIAAVCVKLRGSGATLDRSDLEASYATAWQGLYMAVLEGEEIENPTAWLVQVTFRRAIDEHRARMRVHRGADARALDADASQASAELEADGSHEPDLAAALDDRAKLRQLLEGLRGRLNAREREAAVLCYLQGYSRSQAAKLMGVSDGRMRKLMEGSGVGRPGVAGKVGALVQTIRDGGWCEEQGSLMRALAYGILDPDGERYQLALAHRRECPSCRVYVTSLRGLAATLPPVFLPWGVGAAVLARAGGTHVGAAVGTTGGGVGATGGASTGAGASAGAVSAAGAAGAGAGASGMAGGGWLFAGTAKLAVGCVLALSVGAGCVALDVGGERSGAPREHRRVDRAAGVRVSSGASTVGARAVAGVGVAPVASSSARSAALTPAARAGREFGPEQGPMPASPSARVSSAHASAAATSKASAGRSAGAPSAVAESHASASGAASAAEREFAPG